MVVWLTAHWQDIMLIVSVVGMILERKRAQTNGELVRTLTGAIEVSDNDATTSNEVQAAMKTAPPSVQLALEAALSQTTDPAVGTPHKRSIGKELVHLAVPMLLERALFRRR